MTGPVKLAWALYSRLLSASNELRRELDPFLNAIRRTGTIPLGCRWNEAGELEYCWLVHEPGRFASAAELERQLRDRSPPNAKLVVLFL